LAHSLFQQIIAIIRKHLAAPIQLEWFVRAKEFDGIFESACRRANQMEKLLLTLVVSVSSPSKDYLESRIKLGISHGIERNRNYE
jgi:hypothetical protein